MQNTIALKGEFIRKEVEATGVVLPGMQVTMAGAAGGGQRKAFALENDIIGRGIDDAYAVGEVIQVGCFGSGTEVYAYLAAGENVSAGAALVGDGAGALEAVGSEVNQDQVIAFAAESLNNTTSFRARIRIEVA